MSRNGQLMASAAHATGAVAVNGDWAIGARGTGTERFFQGAIDEVRIYDRPLEIGEIAVLGGAATGPVTSYEYDFLGRQIRSILPDPDGDGPLDSPQTSIRYNAAGQIAATTDPLGNVTTYVYDALGRRTHTIDAQGNIAELRYDSATRAVAHLAPAPTLTAGLRGFWSFVADDGSASVELFQYPDLSGNGHTATAVNGPEPTPGIIGNALQFDGAGDYVSLGNPAGLNITGAITLSAWIKPEATGGLRNIIAHGHATSPNGEVYLRINNGQYQVGSWNGTSYLASAAVPAGDVGTWVHLTGVYDPDAGQWRLYRNGQLLASAAHATGAVAVNGNWAIGARGTGTERFFQGAIDEVRIYDRPLEIGEIAVLAGTATGPATYYVHDGLGRQTHTIDALGNVTEIRYDAASQVVAVVAPAPSLTQDLRGFWSLVADDGSASVDLTRFADLSGNGHTATAVNGPERTAGIIGNALQFDGAGDYVSLGNPAELNFTGAITLSAWIKPEATDGTRNIIAHGHATSPAGEVYLRINNGQYQVGSWNGTNYLASAAMPAGEVGTWVHLAGVYDPDAGQWRLYRNGQLMASAAHATGAVAVNGNWAIGARGTCTERFFQGAIDEVRIYSRALEVGEIGVLAATDTGPIVQYEYDSLGRQVKIIQPDPDGAGPLASPETSYAYDAAGQLTAVTDSLGRVTTFDYDGLGRQVKVTQPDPDGPGGQAPAFQATVYDAAGRVLQTSNALGHTTSYAYDPVGRLVSQTDALGGVTSFRYDALGNRLSLTDPVDNTTTWTYDALNRVVQETNELGDSRYFAYNPGGYLTRRIDRRGLVREFQYDTLGRNTAEIWYDTVADAEMDVNRQNTLSFTYDALGRMLSAGDQFASYAYAYDRLGRMTSSDAAIAGLVATVTLTNAYDAAGPRTQVAAAIGGNADFVTDYMYDQLGRTTSIRQSASPTSVLPVADKRVDFTYDLASQLATLTRYADLSGNQLVAATDYLFDQAGRLTAMTHSKGASVFADYDWAFDEANRMTRFESLIDGAADHTNDDTDQLTAAEYTAGAGLPTTPPDEQYVYDENGNRINNGYTVGLNNQLLSDGTHTYTYNEEGNRTSRTDIATGEITEYAWDHRNRLTRVTTRATANGPLTTDIHYAYDFGQRWIRKTLDTNADGTIEESRIFVHDNGQIVLDFQTTGTGDTSSGDLSHRYLWGHHVDQILADETVDTATADVAWALTDHLNTVRDLLAYDPATDTTSVIKHLTYGAFGNVTNDSAPGIDSLFLFTARPYDPDTGLQNNLNRWYDLSTGRWISEDPIGFDAGDRNLYRYVQNSAITNTDPVGLWLVDRNGRRRADAISQAGDTISDLAALIGFRVSDYGRWITWSGQRQIMGKGKTSVKAITPTDKWCPGERIEVPNTMLAAWFGDLTWIGRTWMDFSRDVGSLRDLGFSVVEFNNDSYSRSERARSEAEFLDRVQGLAGAKELHGLYEMGHGDLSGFGSNGEWSRGPDAWIEFEHLRGPAGIGGTYRLAAAILRSCFSNNHAARWLVSGNNSIFWGAGFYIPVPYNIASFWGLTTAIEEHTYDRVTFSYTYGGRQATRTFRVLDTVMLV
jgi:RHS repeat-associated protein